MADSKLEALKANVKTALTNAGYQIAEGKPYVWGPSGCEKVIPAFHTCFGNNPTSPYIVPIVPHRRDVQSPRARRVRKAA